jgi:endoglucanase
MREHPDRNVVYEGKPLMLVPPAGQPPQKSYRDSNIGTPENSWVINEPAIYHQSGYVKLLSKFSQ